MILPEDIETSLKSCPGAGESKFILAQGSDDDCGHLRCIIPTNISPHDGCDSPPPKLPKLSNMQQRRQICGYCDSQPLPHSPDYHYPRSSTHVLTIFHSNLDEFMHNGANWRLLDCLVVEFPGGARSEIVGIRWNTHRRAKIFLQRSRISSARKQSARKQFLKER